MSKNNNNNNKKIGNSKFDKLKNEIDGFLENIHEIQETLFKAIVQNIYEEVPDKLESFSFTGYTPSYNDGEECTYTLTLDYCDINPSNPEIKLSNKEEIDIQKVIAKYLNILPGDFYRSHFDNNVRVTVTKNDIKVEGYDCGY